MMNVYCYLKSIRGSLIVAKEKRREETGTTLVTVEVGHLGRTSAIRIVAWGRHDA